MISYGRRFEFSVGDRAPDRHITAIAERRRIAILPEAIARAIAFAVEQPDDVDLNEIIVRPTASHY